MIWEKEKDVFLLQPCLVTTCLRGKELGQRVLDTCHRSKDHCLSCPRLCVPKGSCSSLCSNPDVCTPVSSLRDPPGLVPTRPLTCLSNAGFLGKHPGADGVPSPRSMRPALDLPYLVQFSSSFLHPSFCIPRPTNPLRFLLQCDNNLHFWELTLFLPGALKAVVSEVAAVFMVIKGFAPSSLSPSPCTSLLLRCTWNPHLGGAGQEGLLWGHSPFILWSTNGLWSPAPSLHL